MGLRWALPLLWTLIVTEEALSEGAIAGHGVEACGREIESATQFAWGRLPRALCTTEHSISPLLSDQRRKEAVESVFAYLRLPHWKAFMVCRRGLSGEALKRSECYNGGAAETEHYLLHMKIYIPLLAHEMSRYVRWRSVQMQDKSGKVLEEFARKRASPADGSGHSTLCEELQSKNPQSPIEEMKWRWHGKNQSGAVRKAEFIHEVVKAGYYDRWGIQIYDHLSEKLGASSKIAHTHLQEYIARLQKKPLWRATLKCFPSNEAGLMLPDEMDSSACEEDWNDLFEQFEAPPGPAVGNASPSSIAVRPIFSLDDLPPTSPRSKEKGAQQIPYDEPIANVLTLLASKDVSLKSKKLSLRQMFLLVPSSDGEGTVPIPLPNSQEPFGQWAGVLHPLHETHLLLVGPQVAGKSQLAQEIERYLLPDMDTL